MDAPGGTRKLAAILAADAVGYSRLMAADETATVAALNESRTIFRERIQAHDGRLIDTAGDSVLAEFPSVVEAVQCAMDVQVALVARNAPLDEDRRMPFRIGVNLGDVIEQADGTIYGDGVNIAARLESLAEPSGINVSGAVYDSVHGKIGSGFAYLGEQAVKNIEQPVRVYRVAADETDRDVGVAGRLARRPLAIATAVTVAVLIMTGVGAWHQGWIGGGEQISVGHADQFRPVLPTGPSIAVLPFANLSGDPEQDYLSDGLTADVIAALGRFANLSVMGRNTTLPYKDTVVASEEIGRALGVRYVLDGAVRRAGDRIRVTAQLTEAESGVHLWSDRFDRAYEDVFAVQDEITSNVAGALAIAVGRLERERALEKPTENLEAYDYVLRGWALVRRGTRAANFDARESFKRAAALDPQYGDAYAGMSYTYGAAVDYGWTEFIARAVDQAEALAQQALALDSSSVAARRSLARVLTARNQLDLAAEQLRHALEINSSDADSYKAYGDILVYLGDAARAAEWFEAGLRLDPKAESWVFSNLGLSYYLMHRYQDAVQVASRAVETKSDFMGLAVIAAAQGQLGNHAEAQRATDDLLGRRPFSTIEQLTVPFRVAEDIAHFADGLIKAGVPTSGAVASDR